MGHRLDDPVDERLRAARPPLAEVDLTAYDADLLARVKSQPAKARHPRPRLALPVAAAVATFAAAAFVLTGGLSGVSSPTRAEAAMTRALHWFDPPAGSILHVRSEMTIARPSGGGSVVVQESWQSVDHPDQQRLIQPSAETDGGGDLYDPATNTIYSYAPPSLEQLRRQAQEAMSAKIEAAERAGASADTVDGLRADRDRLLDQIDSGEPVATGNQKAEVGDALVNQIRRLLEHGDAAVGDMASHDGVDAYPITFRPGGENAPRWRMWTSASDGRPLELRIDGGGPVSVGAPGLETVRWTTYEVVFPVRSHTLLTVSGAHPDARFVTDAAAYRQAYERLFPNG